jgi:hypothetical protein
MKGYSVADQDHSQSYKGEVVGRVAFIANPDATKLFEPTDGSFDEPAKLSQATAVWTSAFGNNRLNVSTTELLTIVFVIVAAIALQPVRTLAGVTYLTGDGRGLIHEGHGFLHIIPVRSRESKGDRSAVAINQQMDFAAGLAPIYRAGTSLRAGADSTHMSAVNEETREIQLLGEAKAIQ